MRRVQFVQLSETGFLGDDCQIHAVATGRVTLCAGELRAFAATLRASFSVIPDLN